MDLLLRLIFLILISTAIVSTVQGKINIGNQRRLQRSKMRLTKAVKTPRVNLHSNAKRITLHPTKIHKVQQVIMKVEPKPQGVKTMEQNKTMKKKIITKNVASNVSAEVPIKIEVILLVHEIGNKIDQSPKSKMGSKNGIESAHGYQDDERLHFWPHSGRSDGDPHHNKYRLNLKPTGESPLTTTEDYERQNYVHVNPSIRRPDPSFYRNGTRCPKSEISFCWDNGSCSWWQICKTVDCITACHTRSGMEWQWVK